MTMRSKKKGMEIQSGMELRWVGNEVEVVADELLPYYRCIVFQKLEAHKNRMEINSAMKLKWVGNEVEVVADELLQMDV